MEEVVPSEQEKLYTTTQIAAMFQVSIHTVRSWLRDGKLVAIRPNGRYRIPHSKMVEFANQRYGAKQ